MIELNEELKWEFSAQIVVNGTKKVKYKRGELKELREKLKEFTDPVEKAEAKALLLCVLMGRKVKVEEGKILLFFHNQPSGKVGPAAIISGNPKMCEILAQLI